MPKRKKLLCESLEPRQLLAGHSIGPSATFSSLQMVPNIGTGRYDFRLAQTTPETSFHVTGQVEVQTGVDAIEKMSHPDGTKA